MLVHINPHITTNVFIQEICDVTSLANDLAIIGDNFVKRGSKCF
jgi:hypothetical protein